MVRRYLVYVETLTGLGEGTRAAEPIGIIGVTGAEVVRFKARGRLALGYLDVARSMARLQFGLTANQRAHCVLDTTMCNAIDKLCRANRALSVAEALATVRRHRAQRKANKAAKGGPAASPHGAGLL